MSKYHPKAKTVTKTTGDEMFKDKFKDTELLHDMPELPPINNSIAPQPLVKQAPPNQSLLQSLGQEKEFVFSNLQYFNATGEFEVTVNDVNHIRKTTTPIKVRYYSIEDAMDFIKRMGCSNGPNL